MLQVRPKYVEHTYLKTADANGINFKTPISQILNIIMQ